MLHILSNAELDQYRISDSPDVPESEHMPHLPVISAGGFDAYVLCMVGETRTDQSGNDVTYVSFLCLLGMGTAVAAVWASLMDQRQLVVTVESIGNVQLWQRQPECAHLGYTIAWHRRTRVLQLAHGARLVHLVTEPDLLTMRDPDRAEAGARRRKRGSDGTGECARRGVPQTRPIGSVAPHATNNTNGSEMTAADAAAMEQVSEQAARETRPLFVLLGRRDEDAATLARRHLLFLAERIQWLAYYEPWADFFWQRGLATGEIRPLAVWPVASANRAGGDESAWQEQRWITSAYLCQPDPLALADALPDVVRAMSQPQNVPTAPHTPDAIGASSDVPAAGARREQISDEGREGAVA